jgi:hypothetical protein
LPLAAVYLVAVVAFEVLRRMASWPRVDDLASSPTGVASGDVGSLLTSGLVVAGDPVVQLTGTALTAGLVIVVLGAPAFWTAVLAAHVGSAVIAYAGVGVVWLLSRADVDSVIDAPDYGISCVWAGAAGALAGAALLRRTGATPLIAVLAVAGFLVAIPPAMGLAGVEHGLAFVLGALAIWLPLLRASAPLPVVA